MMFMNEDELTKLINIAYTSNNFTKKADALSKIEAQFKGYISLVKTIETYRNKDETSRKKLYEIAHELKQNDDEHWAVGEMLERTMIMFSALDYENGEYIGNKK